MVEASPLAVPESPAHSERSDSDIKIMLNHKLVTSPDSAYTLEHRRQTPEEKKLIYCVRFDPEDCKNLAIGIINIFCGK